MPRRSTLFPARQAATHKSRRLRRAQPAKRQRQTTHGRTEGRTDNLSFTLTQPPALSNPTTQFPEESNLHGRDSRRTDGRDDGRDPFSLTLHNLTIFLIQRPRFPKSLTGTAEIDDARRGERTDGSLSLLPYTAFSIFSIQRPRFPKTLTCTAEIFSFAPFAKRKSSAAHWKPTRVTDNKNL
jgi:hypothetical protein